MEDSYFVGLQGESDCSFLGWAQTPSVREPYPPLSVCLSIRRSLLNTEGTDMEEQPLFWIWNIPEVSREVRKKLFVGKTLSITKAHFTLSLPSHLTCHMCFFFIWFASFSCRAFSLWLWDIKRPELCHHRIIGRYLVTIKGAVFGIGVWSPALSLFHLKIL